MDNKINQIAKTKQSMLNLISEIEQSSKGSTRIDKVEGDIFKSLLEIGKQLLVLHIELVKNKTEQSQHLGKEQGYENKGLLNRSYFSVFGMVDYERKKYYVQKKKK